MVLSMTPLSTSASGRAKQALEQNPQIIYNLSTGMVSYDSDGAGSQQAQDVAFIGKNLSFFDAKDILLI